MNKDFHNVLVRRIAQFAQPSRSTKAVFTRDTWDSLFPGQSPEAPALREFGRLAGEEGGGSTSFAINTDAVRDEALIAEQMAAKARVVHVAGDWNAQTRAAAAEVVALGYFGVTIVLAQHAGPTSTLRSAVARALADAGSVCAQEQAVTLSVIHGLPALDAALASGAGVWHLVVVGAPALGTAGHAYWARAVAGRPAIRSVVLLGDATLPPAEPGFSLAHYHWGSPMEMRDRAARDWAGVRFNATARTGPLAVTARVALARDGVRKDRSTMASAIGVSEAARVSVVRAARSVLVIPDELVPKLSLEDWTLVGSTARLWAGVEARADNVRHWVERSRSRPPQLTVEISQ